MIFTHVYVVLFSGPFGPFNVPGAAAATSEPYNLAHGAAAAYRGNVSTKL